MEPVPLCHYLPTITAYKILYEDRRGDYLRDRMLDRKKSQARVIAKLIDSSKVIVPSEATQAEEINVHPPINPTLIHVRSFLDMCQPG